jgi:hypothetical protein
MKLVKHIDSRGRNKPSDKNHFVAGLTACAAGSDRGEVSGAGASSGIRIIGKIRRAKRSQPERSHRATW